MEVILLERVARLGGMGDVANVKNGFARNYLIPQGKAMRATAANKAEFEVRKSEISKQNDARKVEADKFAKKIEGTIVELVRQASDDGRLYGSVTVRDIGAALTEKGFEIPRQNLLLERSIKEIGSYEVKVMPHPEIEVVLPVRIARNESEFLTWDDAPEEEEVVEAPADETTSEEDAA
ncbi:MAG: 50S ribosomal protein L9 [Rickettsiales bacterium]|nr:50S ribosomal protein L9 [Rickettsiales bacterium]